MDPWTNSEILKRIELCHADDKMSWLETLALFERINEPVWRLAQDFKLHPVHIRWYKMIPCEERLVPKRVVLDYLMSKVTFDTVRGEIRATSGKFERLAG